MRNTMNYLGYREFNENGAPNPAFAATIKGLQGRSIEGVMLPSAIATEYAKHAPQRWTMDPNFDVPYCSKCGVAFCRQHI